MTDHYGVLGLEPGAKQDEIETAFKEQLEVRRASHRGTSDLHAAFAVVGDRALRKTYDATRFGIATTDRLVHAKAVTLDFARDSIPEIDVQELCSQAKEVVLKVTVLGSGALAKAAETAASVSRAVQVAASRRLERES